MPSWWRSSAGPRPACRTGPLDRRRRETPRSSLTIERAEHEGDEKMSLRQRLKNDPKALRMIGNACMVAGFLAHVAMRPPIRMSEDLSDGLFGFFLAMAIGFM